MNAVNDFMAILLPYFFEQDADKKKELAKPLNEESIPYWLGKFEKRLVENVARGNQSGFCVGDTLTVADLKLHAALEFLDRMDDFSLEELTKPAPKLAALMATINGMEQIQKYNAMFKGLMAKTAADPNDSVHVIEGRNEYIQMDKPKEDSVSMTITYLNIRGRGDALRMAAYINGVSYKDVVISCGYSMLSSWTIEYDFKHESIVILLIYSVGKHLQDKAAGLRRWGGVPEVTFHDKDGNDVQHLGQSNVCLQVIGMYTI